MVTLAVAVSFALSPLPLLLPSPTPTLLPSPLPLPSPSPSQSPIAVTTAVGHCCSCREPSPPPSLSRCRQPLLLPLLLPLDIAVLVIIGHCSCHRCRPSLLPCCWPFLRVVALAWQELYSTNRSKECLFYFILFCWDSGWCIDRSWITYQVLSGDGQHQRWAASNEP